MDNNNSRIIKNTLWLYVRMLMVTIISLYTSRIVLKVLGFEDYGIYNLAGGVVAFLSILTGTMTNSTQRFLNKEKAIGNKNSLSYLMEISIKLHKLLAWIIFLASETIGLFIICFVLKLPPERYVASIFVYQASVIALVFSILQIPFTSLIITYEKFSFIAVTGLVDVVIKLVLVLGLLFIPFDKLIFYGFSMSAASVLQCIWYMFCSKKYYIASVISYREVVNSKIGRQLVSFSSWNLLGSFGNMLVTQGVGIVFNMFYVLSVNAALGITTQVTNTIATFVNNVQLAFRPQLLQSYSQKDNIRFQSLVCNCSKWSFFLILFIAVPLICNIRLILRLWLGDVPEYTAEFVIILIFYLMIDALGNPIYYGIEAQGDIKKYQIILFVILILNLFAAWCCCSLSLSPSLAILTKLVTNVIVYILRIAYLKSYNCLFSIKYYISKCVFPALLVSVVSFCFLLFCYEFANYQILISTVLYWPFLIVSIFVVGMSQKQRVLLYEITLLKYKGIKDSVNNLI